MASYKLEVRASARRDARKIDPQQLRRILTAIRSLQDDPFPPHHKKLQGAESGYRLCVGDYRILYEVNVEEKRIVVGHVRHRRDAYRR